MFKDPWDWDEDYYLRRAVRMFERANSVTLGRNIWANIVNTRRKEAPAWSTDDEIWFNSAHLDAPTDDLKMMALRGVNQHELAHIVFTPQKADYQRLVPDTQIFATLLQDSKHQAMWNIFEDQRIENLLIRKYSNQRPYLLACFQRYILEAQKDHEDTAYVLVRGRRWLPVRIRRRLMRKFKTPQAIPAIRKLIDEYITLDMISRQGMIRGHDLISQMVKLMDEHDLWATDDSGELDMHTCGAIITIALGRERNQSDLDDIRDQVHGNAHALAEQDWADPEGDADPDSLGLPGVGLGGGESYAEPSVSEDVADLIRQAMQDAGVQHEMNTARAAMEKDQPIVSPQIRTWQRMSDPGLPQSAKMVARALETLEQENDPYWKREQTSGRFDVMKALRDPDADRVFSQWVEGGQQTNDQEWVVLLDVSGSMSTHIPRLNEAAWMMKRACDIVHATCTVIIYGTSEQVVYRGDDRADLDEMPRLSTLGGTAPIDALTEAFYILNHSDRPNKGLLVMTDGDWSTGGNRVFGSTTAAVQAINGLGVLTHMVAFNHRPSSTHAMHTVSTIKRLNELPEKLKEQMKVFLRRQQNADR